MTRFRTPSPASWILCDSFTKLCERRSNPFLNIVQATGINVNIVHFQGEGNVNDVVYASPRPAAQGEVLDRNALFLGPAIRDAGERGWARQGRCRPRRGTVV